MDDQSKRIWQGAVVLALAMVIVKILSVVYRIPYQNITGDTGFYVFQQVYPFYGIASTFALAGFPVALSRILSESGEMATHRKKRVQEAFTAFFAAGILLFFLLFFGSAHIASWMGDARLQLPIQATSFIYLLVPFVAVFRGIFQGAEQMKPTAYSQVVEQSIRVLCIIGFSYYFMSQGYSVYTAGAAATSGSVVGALAGLLVLFLFFSREQKERRWMRPRFIAPGKGSVQLLSAGLLLSLCSMILLLFQLADAFTFVNFLSKSGIALESARKIKGIFDRAQPLLQLGTVIATSLSLAAVPAVAAAKRRGDDTSVRKICSLSIKVVFIIGLAAAAGLGVIIEPVNTMLFENKEGSLEIAVLGLSILPVSLFLTSTGLLQGLGSTIYPVISVLLAFLLKIAGNAVLMSSLHELGASAATVLASFLAAGINLVFLEKRTGFAAAEKFYGVRIGSAVALMALSAWLIKSGLAAALPETRTASAVISLGASAGGGIVLLAALLLAKVFRADDLMRIPKLQKIQHILSRWKERRS
ncbi:polysaccharide biosynthesis protein [Fictibacillus enclensis]|uniref:putative polysaccharide biosynthesis protein n=1 Tax=Fictibacillus enclensis TaxID=1017270 RepID=UPI0025A2CF08|nr:polysaccharide biosynthesis protein [Fictibacillus enclensis]MDM5196837.1 polysaccharide biosynthesis protein [Fictibacillus enclensis]